MVAFYKEVCIIYGAEHPLHILWLCNFISGLVAQLGERSVRIREVEGSNPFRSTKQGSDEHLFLQRRFCREVFALIRNRKAPSWERPRDGVFLLSAHLIYANPPATMVAERNRRLYKFTFSLTLSALCNRGRFFSRC